MPPKTRSGGRVKQTSDATKKKPSKHRRSEATRKDDVPRPEPSSDPHDSTFDVEDENGKKIACQRFGDPKSRPGLMFTHGASGGLSNPATRAFAQGFSKALPTVCFKGSMNLQSRVKGFHAVINDQDADAASLGGRSMGARAAVIAAADHSTKTLVLVSYPLIGQNGTTRDQILLDIDASMAVLFVSGDRDNMCPLERLAEVRSRMKATSWLMTVQGADHGMSLAPKDAIDEVREYTGKAASRWVEDHDASRTECSVSWDKDAHSIDDSGWQQPSTQPDDIERPAKRRKKA